MDSAPIYIFSASGAIIGSIVAEALKSHPWISPAGTKKSSTILYLPSRLAVAPPLIAPGLPIRFFDSIRNLVETTFSNSWAHIFIGATGIAVRAIAPFLTHKSKDPPVVVIDPAAQHVISLLSGHWGGANDLTRYLADILDADPVITTASEALNRGRSLDSLIQAAGLRILDWHEMPAMQGRLLAGESAYLYDPLNLMPSVPYLMPVSAPEEAHDSALLLVDYKRHEARKLWIRAGPPAFYLGFGFRKKVRARELVEAYEEFCSILNLPCGLVRACGSVIHKAMEPAAIEFASEINATLESFMPEELAAISTPNPGMACGKRFGLPPFSVCESAALLAAVITDGSHPMGNAHQAVLWAEKHKFNNCITMALAVKNTFWKKAHNTFHKP